MMKTKGERQVSGAGVDSLPADVLAHFPEIESQRKAWQRRLRCEWLLLGAMPFVFGAPCVLLNAWLVDQLIGMQARSERFAGRPPRFAGWSETLFPNIDYGGHYFGIEAIIIQKGFMITLGLATLAITPLTLVTLRLVRQKQHRFWSELDSFLGMAWSDAARTRGTRETVDENGKERTRRETTGEESSPSAELSAPIAVNKLFEEFPGIASRRRAWRQKWRLAWLMWGLAPGGLGVMVLLPNAWLAAHFMAMQESAGFGARRPAFSSWYDAVLPELDYAASYSGIEVVVMQKVGMAVAGALVLAMTPGFVLLADFVRRKHRRFWIEFDELLHHLCGTNR